MKKSILLALLLGACTATGPVYNEADVKENLIIYRPSHTLASARTFHIAINSEAVCKLGNGGFFATNLATAAEVSADAPDMPGTARLKVSPPAYVRVEANSSKFLATGFGGLLGMGTAEAASNSPGPYILTQIPPEQARAELQGLKRDCMPENN